MSTSSGSISVFDRFTIFSILIPGLFAVALILPFTPVAILNIGGTLDLTIILALLFGLVFVSGSILHLFSGFLEEFQPPGFGLEAPDKLLERRINEYSQRVQEGNDLGVMGRLFRDYLHAVERDYGLGLKESSATVERTEAEDDINSTARSDKENPTGGKTSNHILPAAEAVLDEKDYESLLWICLNQGWSSGNRLIRIQTSVYYFCRSMTLLVFFGLLTYATILTQITLVDSIRTPIFLAIGSTPVFAAMMFLLFLGLLSGLRYGYRQYVQRLLQTSILIYLETRDVGEQKQ